MLPGKHGLSFRNEVRTGVATWDEAPQEKTPARRHDEDDNAKPLHNRKTTQSSAWCTTHPPAARLSAARSKMAPRSDAHSAPLAVLLEYGPPVFLLGTVLVVIVLKELGYLNIKY